MSLLPSPIVSAFTKVSTTPSLNTAEYIADSPFTVTWLLESLESNDETFKRISASSKVEKVSGRNIGEGKGYLSKVYRVSINFENIQESYDVVMKVPGREAVMKLAEKAGTSNLFDDKWVSEAHKRECQFYSDYARYLDDIPLLKIYAAEEMSHLPGVLLMESAVDTTEICPVWETANEFQIFNVAKHLSSLYAHFLCLPPDSWIGRYPTNPLTDFFTAEFFYSHIDKLAALKPKVFDEAISVFRKYVSSKKFYNYTMTEVHKDLGLPAVLCHGDIWSNNLLWRKDASGSASNELSAMIDWQLMHEGCLTHDITAFMFLSVDGHIRREHQYNVLRFMYDRIAQLVGGRGKDVSFTFEQMKTAFHTNGVAQTAQLLVLPSFLFSLDGLSEDEARVVRSRQERFIVRVQLAMEEGLQWIKHIPKEKIE